MAELVPHPLGRLASRMFRELERHDAIFDLERRRFVTGLPGRDLSVRLHGKTVSTPLGPAAGPHTQLAQNLVLAFLGGGRIFELKTVQVQDRLEIPRPCIDMRTTGYNVEWSQELTLEQSLEEYVKASMLVDILVASGKLGLQPGFERALFDMSVGYDLAGIRGERVGAFLRGMVDARALVERLRRELPAPWRDVDFRTRISDTLTLSTFHGCPPGEIEQIARHLLEDVGLHTIVKLNPTLLGKQDLRALLNDRLGYPDHVPDEAFDKDATWTQACDFVGRLGEVATRAGLGFGVKFTNTLVVENRGDFLPATEKLAYLSGPPLHVLAMNLVGRFRAVFGERFPVSFTGGITKHNFPDAVALGLTPITVSSDLLRTGGYARMEGYFRELEARMEAVGARTVDELRQKGAPGYIAGLVDDPRYAHAQNRKPPKKVGSHLALLDCLTCDKCIPVCPNDANFACVLPMAEIPVVKLRHEGGAWTSERTGTLKVEKKHQIANFADFCNECGNCDVFCPEDGGPYAIKPRFFGSREGWARHADRDGFFVEDVEGERRVLGRFGGRAFRLTLSGGRATYGGDGFEVRFAQDAPEETLEGHADVVVDLAYFHLMRWLSSAVLDGDGVNYVNVT